MLNLDNIMRARSITVTPGTLMTIETNVVPLENRKCYILYIGTAFPTFIGTEAVQLTINGVNYPLIDNAGNVVVAGTLRDGKMDDCGNIKTAKYRLQFGSDGMPNAVPHFVVHDGLCQMRYNGVSGSNDNTTSV